MDFEKLYKEALEQAKAGKPLDEVFPELKESEDERIRKIIIKHFEEIANRDEQSWTNLDIPYILAYLEKQKEQKPLSTEETELNSIAFLEQLGYTCIPPGAEQKPTNSEKPKEWSEDDEKMLRTIISDCSRCVELDSKQIAWLKSLRPQPHWKPSEVQMKALMLAIEGKWEAILPTGYMSHRLEDLYNDLKKLM